MEISLKKRILLFSGSIFGTLFIITIGQFVGLALVAIPNEILKHVNPSMITDAWLTGKEYFYFIGIWIVAVGFMYFSNKNRPILKAIGTKPRGNKGSIFLLGILGGFCLNGLCILIAGLHNDINLDFRSFRPISFIIIFLCVLVQSSAEELLCRGFLYQKGIEYFRKPAIAIVANAMLFAILHIFNDGVTIISIINIFLSGLMFSMIVYYFDSIWCAFAIHTAWNFTQNILFGLPNSGIVVPYSVFKLNASTARNSFAYNINFGIEGTIAADIVLGLACVAILIWGRKHPKKAYDVWEEKEQVEERKEAAL